MILPRYLLRQAGATSALTLLVLLGVVSALFLAELLGQAAQGQLPTASVLGLLVLRLPEALLMVAPLALMVGVLFSLGQAYESGELIIARASGLSFGACFQPLIGLVFVWGAMVLLVAGWLSPWTIQQTQTVIENAAGELLVSGIQPGQFDRLDQGRLTIYVAEVEGEQAELRDVFVQHAGDRFEETVTAPEGRLWFDTRDGSRYLSLIHGHQLRRDEGGWMQLRFQTNDVRLPPPVSSANQQPEMAALLPALWPPTSAVEQRELHWRLAPAVGTALLGLLAIPLAWRTPKGGRFGAVVAAVLVYLMYSNAVHVGLVWMEQSNQVEGPGLWPMHAGLAGLVVVLGMKRWQQW